MSWQQRLPHREPAALLAPHATAEHCELLLPDLALTTLIEASAQSTGLFIEDESARGGSLIAVPAFRLCEVSDVHQPLVAQVQVDGVMGSMYSFSVSLVDQAQQTIAEGRLSVALII